MLEMKLAIATCEAVMGVLPESTDSLKTCMLALLFGSVQAYV